MSPENSNPPQPPVGYSFLPEMLEVLQQSIERLQGTTTANTTELGGVKMEVHTVVTRMEAHGEKIDALTKQVSEMVALEGERKKSRDEFNYKVWVLVIGAITSVIIQFFTFISQTMLNKPYVGPPSPVQQPVATDGGDVFSSSVPHPQSTP